MPRENQLLLIQSLTDYDLRGLQFRKETLRNVSFSLFVLNLQSFFSKSFVIQKVSVSL
nr:MAG TPA: hypothetical protein [Caudoviricetes sp.]